MNAFNLFPAAPTVAPEVAAANQVLSSGKQTAQLLLNTYQMSYNLVWNNKNASPDKVDRGAWAPARWRSSPTRLPRRPSSPVSALPASRPRFRLAGPS